MGVIQLPDELQRVIERQVAEGRAVNAAAFLEEAVRRLIEEATTEEDELFQATEAGSADITAGRYVRITTADDEERVHGGMMTRLRARLSAGN